MRLILAEGSELPKGTDLGNLRVLSEGRGVRFSTCSHRPETCSRQRTLHRKRFGIV